MQHYGSMPNIFNNNGKCSTSWKISHLQMHSWTYCFRGKKNKEKQEILLDRWKIVVKTTTT